MQGEAVSTSLPPPQLCQGMGYKRQQPLGNSSHRKIPPKPHCHAGTGVAGSLSLPVVAGRPGLLVPQEQQLQRRGDGDPCG